MLNIEVKYLYLNTNKSEIDCNINVEFVDRDYQHTPKDGISYNIETYNIKNLSLDNGTIIKVATHWNPPQIIDSHFYGQLIQHPNQN